MSQEPRPSAPAPKPGRPRGRRRRALGRWTRRGIELSAALVAAVFVAFFSIDLGRIDSLRVKAEGAASDYFGRPVHIEAIHAHLWPGEFSVEGFVVEGRSPGDRPFLAADSIRARIDWSDLLRREVNVEARMTDWQMVIETWEGGEHSLPSFGSGTADEAEPAEAAPAAVEEAPGESGGVDVSVRFVYATGGQFTLLNHGDGWSVVAPNLSVNVVRSAPQDQLVGTARFSEGTVQILDFLPMRADFETRFTLDGAYVTLHEIDLVTDGADTTLHGWVDLGNWPSQRYEIDSQVDFARMRQIFWDGATWDASGRGRFRGFFQMDSEGRELSGDFTSPEAAINAFRFPNLAGSLTWLRDRFHVRRTTSDFYGGRLALAYGLEPLGTPGGAPATFEATYEDVELRVLGDAFGWQTLQPDGRMTGSVAMRWANGHFGESLAGSGETTVASRGPVVLATAALPVTPYVDRGADPAFDPHAPLGRFALGGRAAYTFDGEGFVFDRGSWAATPSTYIAFDGRTNGDDASLAFAATSYDWLASDRLLAAALTTYGSRTGAVDVGGRGTFVGRMTGAFSAPRVEGRFTAEDLRAWDVVWGETEGDIVVQDDYVDVASGLVRGAEASTIAVDGRFALGFRDDGADEIDATFRLGDWPLADLRHAFGLDDWPVDGQIAEAEIALRGPYRGPFGSGTLRIEPGVAWGERFGSARGDLVFEGTGLRIGRIVMAKSTGTVQGAAAIAWDGTYSFDADGTRIPVEALDNFQFARAPLTGVMRFSTNGAGRFEAPEYEFHLEVPDLFAADEFLGQLNADLTVRGDVLTVDQFEAVSSRLDVRGGGTIALTDASDAQLQVRFFESSLDPYLKFFAPEISPYTRAIVSGELSVSGPLADAARLRADTTIDTATLTLLDYDLRNSAPVELTLENNQFRIRRLELAGQDTELRLSGGIDAADERVDITADGDASLAILQLFFTDLSSSGAATLDARVLGPLAEPSIFGQATIIDGRLRHRAFAHSLTNINGPIVFDTAGVTLDGLAGQLGEGDVDFGGTIALGGLAIRRFDITAVGRAMRLRYPASLRSTVNASFELRGTPEAPTLTGRVDILQANYRARLDDDLLSLVRGGSGMPVPEPIGLTSPSEFPLTFDVVISSGSLPVVELPTATLWATADLRLSGSVDRPSLTGRLTIDRGQAFILGNRYEAQTGYIEFSDPTRIVPYFDIAAETNVRVPGQTYRITVQVTGPPDRFVPTFDSDPYIGSDLDVLSVLLGEQPDLGSLEQRALRTPQAAQQQLLRTGVAQLVASPIAAAVGSVFERVTPVDTVQITPLLGNESEVGQLNPTARITLGKRIGPRMYLTYSRALNAAQFEVILLEVDQNDRLSWIISRNEDRTFALDFRIRYVF